MKIEIVFKTPIQLAYQALALNKKQPIPNMSKVADKLAGLDNGHNKFLEFIVLFVMIEAPRYWWQEFATYRTAVSSSESTMHTLIKEGKSMSLNEFAQMFEKGTDLRSINICYKMINEGSDINEIKKNIPEGFLQKRLVKINLKTLRNIYHQRKNHKLQEWQIFLGGLLEKISEKEKQWVKNENRI
jgi:hypothetical protein